MYKIIDDKDERMWGMLCHLSALAGFLIPFGSIIGPLVVYSMKKDQYTFVADQGKESLNFQISALIYLMIYMIAIVWTGIVFEIFISVIILIFSVLASIILTVIATVRANDGEYYRYPLSIRFVK